MGTDYCKRVALLGMYMGVGMRFAVLACFDHWGRKASFIGLVKHAYSSC